MIIITKNGQSIHIETKDIAAIGRATSGIKAIKLKDDDEVLVGLPVESNTTLAVFSEYGQAKKTALNEYPLQGKNGVGVSTYKTTPSTGKIIGAAMVTDEDNILLSGKTAICISATDIPLLGRTASGNMMIKNGELNSIVKL